MKSNLLEAAAEILNKSKTSAPAEEMHKMADADVEELGGPTPSKTQDTEIDYTKPIKKATPPGAAPRVGPMAAEKLKEEKDEDEEEMEDEEEDEKEDEMKKESYHKNMKEDVEAMFEGESISEDFKSKVATIFEARVHDRVSQIQEELEARYSSSLEEAITDVTEAITEKVNDYLNYVVEEWMQENAIAIEKGLRTELTEDFIVGLRNLFAENYINIPDEKVDVVEELSLKVEELETQLNEQIDVSIGLAKELNESKKIEVFHAVAEGLTFTQMEKLKSLVESVEFTTEEEFAEKLVTIRENYFPSDVRRGNESSLHESVEDPELSEKVKFSDPRMAVYAQAISRTLPK